MYDELVLFVKVAKLGSFAEASQCTGINPSNLTRKIQKLERDLKLVLLKRDTRNLQLSNAGKQVYDKFCTLETDFDSVITNIEKDRKGINGTINLLLPPSFALKVITPYLADFLSKYPNVNLNITYEDRDTNLIKDNYDLAIVNHRPLKSTQKIKLLCRGKIIFYCYADYLEKAKLPVTQSQLEKAVILGIMLDHGIFEKNSYLINKITGEKTIFNPQYRVIQHNCTLDQHLVMSGPFVGAGIDILLADDIKSGKLIHVLPDYYMPGFEYYLLTNPEGKNARTEAFINFINNCMSSLGLNENMSIS
jgi:DNA-binding transcriptional LysR family regulator